MNPVSARLLSQQLICPIFKDPSEVVSWFGAIQAQDYRAMRRAVVMRTSKPSLMAFKQAFDDGRIIRAHLLRCTWQLVSPEDFGWMRLLCYDKALATMNGWTKSLGFAFGGKEKYQALSIIEKTVGDLGETTEDVIGEALKRGGIPEEHLVYNHQLRRAELEGIVCSGALGPRNTYRLVSERVPNIPEIPREDALALLARKYFRSHSPATLEDFVWWSGLNVRDCQKGITALGGELFSERWKGRNFFIHKDFRTRGFRSGTLRFLPAYDEYLIGYKSRDVVLDPGLAHYAHNDHGIFRPVVALDGEIVGNWKPSAKDGGVTIFKSGVSVPQELIAEQVRGYS
ncbi:MAG: AlkZ family DNA glycosylase [Bacteroidales bacterium]|nr:AlkZ family DNA glycosylase [Bacteroidales bacterium]